MESDLKMREGYNDSWQTTELIDNINNNIILLCKDLKTLMSVLDINKMCYNINLQSFGPEYKITKLVFEYI